MAEAYRFRCWLIRADMVEALEAYIKDGRPLGDFLTAIVSNDFVHAAGLADEDNLFNLQAYASYLYNEMPRALWGDAATINAWIEAKALARLSKETNDA